MNNNKLELILALFVIPSVLTIFLVIAIIISIILVLTINVTIEITIAMISLILCLLCAIGASIIIFSILLVVYGQEKDDNEIHYMSIYQYLFRKC